MYYIWGREYLEKRSILYNELKHEPAKEDTTKETTHMKASLYFWSRFVQRLASLFILSLTPSDYPRNAFSNSFHSSERKLTALHILKASVGVDTRDHSRDVWFFFIKAYASLYIATAFEKTAIIIIRMAMILSVFVAMLYLSLHLQNRRFIMIHSFSNKLATEAQKCPDYRSRFFGLCREHRFTFYTFLQANE